MKQWELRWNEKTYSPVRIAVPPTFLDYNQTPFLPYDWLGERLGNRGPCEDRRWCNICKSSLKKWHWCSLPRILPTLFLKTPTKNYLSFIITWKQHTFFCCFFLFKMVFNPKEQYSKYSERYNCTSPHCALRAAMEMRETQLSKLSRQDRGKRWRRFCSTGGMGRNQLCREWK